VRCDFEENGMLEAAVDEDQARQLEEHHATYKSLGSTRRCCKQGTGSRGPLTALRRGLKFPYGGIVNRRSWRAVSSESSKRVTWRCASAPWCCGSHRGRCTTSKPRWARSARPCCARPQRVLAEARFLRDRVLPLCSYVIATSRCHRRNGVHRLAAPARHRDMRVLFDYQRPTADGAS